MKTGINEYQAESALAAFTRGSAIERLGYWKLKTPLIIPYKRDKISLFRFSTPVFHHSIIPVWKKKNGFLRIPCYQHFLEFPIH